MMVHESNYDRSLAAVNPANVVFVIVVFSDVDTFRTLIAVIANGSFSA